MNRSVRSLASGLAFASLVPAVAAAQAGRNFDDSWFWGAKVGTMSFSTKSAHNVAAPLIGGEWLITRSKGALYISAEQVFFNRSSVLTSNQGAVVPVSIRDMQRVMAAALAFPGLYGRALRPYGGVGLALNFIRSAHASDSIPTSFALNAPQAIEDQKSSASVVVIAGLQAQYRRFSVFGQADMMPSTKTFFFNDRATYTISAGLRWNFGTSIDRPE
ncbi:MAG: hypothetical protein M3081_09360 [Gemmatimonadota bacterium]|nr:hypothetical protein [Gemmatimonadota bacterium]